MSRGDLGTALTTILLEHRLQKKTETVFAGRSRINSQFFRNRRATVHTYNSDLFDLTTYDFTYVICGYI